MPRADKPEGEALKRAEHGNIRDAISQDELRVLAELETKVAGFIDLGMSISDITQNPRLINLYRRKI